VTAAIHVIKFYAVLPEDTKEKRLIGSEPPTIRKRTHV